MIASKMSIALQAMNVVITESNDFRIPRVTDEAAADWYAEGTEISIEDAELGEIVARPRRVAGLSRVSDVLASGSNPAAATVVGESIARSISAKIDAALFGNADGTGTPLKGLGAFTDSAVTAVTAPESWAGIDPFIQAQFKVDAAGGNLTAFIANPADAETLVKLKRKTDSNEPSLLQSPTARRDAALVESSCTPALLCL